MTKQSKLAGQKSLFEDHFIKPEDVEFPIINTLKPTWRDEEDRREEKELRLKCLQMSVDSYDEDGGTANTIRRGAAFYNYVTREAQTQNNA